jgi:hypothetical protein
MTSTRRLRWFGRAGALLRGWSVAMALGLGCLEAIALLRSRWLQHRMTRRALG